MCSIFIEVPNLPVAMDAWGRLACYPRGSLLPISSGPTTRYRRITKTVFRPCSTCPSHNQASLSLYTTSLDFHPRLADLCTPPLLFRWRSPQPNCPPNTVSTVFPRMRVQGFKEWYFTVARALHENYQQTTINIQHY